MKKLIVSIVMFGLIPALYGQPEPQKAPNDNGLRWSQEKCSRGHIEVFLYLSPENQEVLQAIAKTSPDRVDSCGVTKFYHRQTWNINQSLSLEMVRLSSDSCLGNPAYRIIIRYVKDKKLYVLVLDNDLKRVKQIIAYQLANPVKPRYLFHPVMRYLNIKTKALVILFDVSESINGLGQEEPEKVIAKKQY